MPRVSFDSTKKPLDDILRKARDGVWQLPDFQRGWVWDDDGLRGLLASISRSFPVGALMTLKTGGEVRFKPRLIEGAPASNSGVQPEALLLDGQQRVTSLYQTTMQPSVVHTINAKRQRIGRFYYIDMQKALDEHADRFDAIVGLPEARVETKNFGREVVLDLSTPEHEYNQLMFPCNRIFDWNGWQTGFVAHWNYTGEKTQFWFHFLNEVLAAFHQYQLPVIELGKETSREAVCLVFEKVNTGGKKLDAFELLTAIYAGEEEGFHLREQWATIAGRLGASLELAENPLTKLGPTEFFQALALLFTRERRLQHIASGLPGDPPPISCTRETVLGLPLSAYKRYVERLEEGFRKAGRFLVRQNIYWHKDVPYQSQLVPLAAMLAELDARVEQDSVRRKLSQWYWCGVFGELYGGAIETRFAKDVGDVLDWIDGGGEPTTVRDAGFRADRLNTMTSRLSAAYKGVHALLMKSGARDFRTDEPFSHTTYFDDAVDIHHIFPRAWCIRQGLPKSRYDTIVNKTPLSFRTNRIIGGESPSRYLVRIAEQGGADSTAIDQRLLTHLIAPDLLRADDFDAFMQSRANSLLGIIEEAIGKPVYRGSAVDEPVEDTAGQPEPDEAEE